MKAIRIQKFGGPEVLQLEDVSFRPAPESNQILIEVKAAGVNPVDAYVREGNFGTPKLPLTPGGDAAGIVVAVGEGENTRAFKVGDRVFTCEGGEPLTGTYAEFAVVPALRVFPLSSKLTFAQGAALGVPYLTAMRSLMHKAKGKAGERILIHGASGAVGLAACQIAAAWKMEVYGTAGTEEGLKLISANGASKVYNHRDKNHAKILKEATKGKGFDVILEMLANENLGLDSELLAKFGRIVIVGSRGEAKVSPHNFMTTEGVCMGVMLMMSTDEEWEEIGNELVKGIKEGWIKPIIDMEFPLEKAVEAHRAVMEHKGGAKGKIVLTVSE